MSDTGRESITDKISKTVMPESQKSTGDKAGDKLSGAADSVAGKAQPEQDKSMMQKASDAVTGK